MKVSRRDNLDRYYVFQVLGFAIFIHYIHHDESESFHNHPWPGFSIILGAYREERLGQRPRIKWWLNWIGKMFHRVTLPNGPVWTIFSHFRRNNKWRVVNRCGGVLSEEPWRGIGGQTNYSGIKSP